MDLDALVSFLVLLMAPLLTERFAGEPALELPMPVESSCRTAPEPAWIRPDDPADRARSDSWCLAVGPPANHAPSEADLPATVDSLAVLVWNANVGAGEIGGLLDDLRSGKLSDGAPVEHFVLLLQEAHRDGPEVPASPPREARWAGRIGNGRVDIVELARRERLHLFYVPSMRNGSPRDGSMPADRGNAVLSTLPLEDRTAIELPVERQRRVAVAATIEGRNGAGIPWKLRLVSAHLENRARWARLHRALGAAQTRQARALVASLERLSPVPASAVGGDFNTWLRGEDAGALVPLRVRYPSIEVHPEGDTRDLPLFLPGLRLDHLFLRLPRGWSGHYEILADRYGSDHQPLIGWVRTGA